MSEKTAIQTKQQNLKEIRPNPPNPRHPRCHFNIQTLIP
jgi:hypothetical protein